MQMITPPFPPPCQALTMTPQQWDQINTLLTLSVSMQFLTTVFMFLIILIILRK